MNKILLKVLPGNETWYQLHYLHTWVKSDKIQLNEMNLDSWGISEVSKQREPVSETEKEVRWW